MFLLLSWAFISMLGYITLLFSLSDYATSIGLSRAQATQITAFLNLGTACGRPFIGVASDRLDRIEMLAFSRWSAGLGCLVIWLPSASFGVTVCFALISGPFWGSSGMVSPTVLKPSSANLRESYVASDNWPTLCRSYRTRGGILAAFTVVVDSSSSNCVYVRALQSRLPLSDHKL
jgi:MFS family permease